MFDPRTTLTELTQLVVLMATLPLLSCTGQLQLADDDTAMPDDDTAMPDDDTGDDDDTAMPDDDTTMPDDDTGDDDDTSPFAGSYTGAVELTHAAPDGQVLVACTGEAVLGVDTAGVLQGDGQCQPNDNLPPLPIAFDGHVDGDGTVSGAATHVTPFGEEPYPLTGGFSGGGGFLMQWEGDMQTPNGEVIHFVGTVNG